MLDQQCRQQHHTSSNDTYQLQEQSQQPQPQPQQNQQQQQPQPQPQLNQQQLPQHQQQHQQQQSDNETSQSGQNYRPRKSRKLPQNAGDLTIILGDSKTKGINTTHIRRSTSKNVIIRTFPGATTNDMLDYIKPSLRLQPTRIIVHGGTNDLKSNAITENTSKLCDEIYDYCPKIDITISQLITRADSPSIDEKVTQLNNLLQSLAEARN